MKHVVIIGSGRSGTNRMLDVFDQHDDTLCRNELHALDTAFAHFPDVDRVEDLPPDFPEQWDRAVEASSWRFSARDRMKVDDKRYFRPVAGPVVGLMRRQKIRSALFGGGDEWPIPKMLRRPGATVVPVIKLLTQGVWLQAVHETQPEQVIIHVIREPAGYLNSWWNRFVLPHGAENVYPRVRKQVAPILADRGLAPLPEAFAMDELLRGELWLWRNLNETISALSASPRYGLFRYEDGMTDPVADTERAFALAGLEFGPAQRDRVASMRKTLFKTSHSEALEPQAVQKAMTAVLDGSPLGEAYLT